MNTIKKRHASKKKHKVVTPSGTIVHLTKGQKDYADGKFKNPQAPLIEIAKAAYPNQSQNTLAQIVNQNEKNTAISIYSNEQVSKAVSTIHELMDSGRDSVRLSASQDVLDRTHGKARQITEVKTTSLSISIDLTGEE
jgi:hypothetical protein